MTELFEAVRLACPAGVWSRGVELARTGAVAASRAEEDRLEVSVSTRGGLIPRTVLLFPEDRTWECPCTDPGRACEHVAAAVIALHRASQEGRSLPTTQEVSGHIGYRLARAAGGLALERVVVRSGSDVRIDATLASLVSRRADGGIVVPAQVDYALEQVLGASRRGVLPPGLVPKILRLLTRCTDVTLDGRPIEVSAEPIVPLGRLADQADGFRLWIEEDPEVTERFANGAAVCGGKLRPVGEPGLTARELHDLARGRHLGPDEVVALVTETLPSLMSRIPVEVRTRRLPRTEAEAPRLLIEARREGTALSVLPTLVYGVPPRARVDGGRLVHLQGPVPLRDEPAERRLARRLAAVLNLAPGQRYDLQGEAAVQFAAKLAAFEGEVEGRDLDFFVEAPPIRPAFHLAPEQLGLEFETEAPVPGRGGAMGRVGAETVLAAWRRGDSKVLLDGGGFAPLPSAWLARHGERLADLLAARDAEGRLSPAATPDLARLCQEMGMPPPPSLDGLRHLLEGFSEIPEARLPLDLTVPLRPYQKRGVDWLVFLRKAGMGALLADDMGLGKTIQTLCALEGRTLIVVPTSVLHNWVDEARRFRPALRVAVYHGGRRYLDVGADVTLTTYALLRLDEGTLIGECWDTVVLDEAQNIKNPDSQVAAAAYRLDARFRIALTGTPVENRLEELWSQFHFINRGLLGGRQDFIARYATPIAQGTPGAAMRLRERIRPFLLRRMKEDVAPELPPRTDAVLFCQLDEAEREVYDTVRAATLQEIVQKLGEGGNVLAALEALLRLRQACCHSGLVPGQQAERSSKIERLLEALESVLAEGHKALVFSQWTSLLDRIEPHLARAGVPYERLDGSTVDRGGVVGRFLDAGGPPVMLVSLKAGGTGLNLTAADHVFLMDPWWNPAVEDQAADRAHRIGQDRPVLVYRLVAEDTVEERILALQERKRALADSALAGAERAPALTREEILELLG